MKNILLLIIFISLATISCRKVVDKFERMTVKACGCYTGESAEEVFQEYKDLAVSQVDKKEFNKNIDYILEMSNDITNCLETNGISRTRIIYFYEKIQNLMRY